MDNNNEKKLGVIVARIRDGYTVHINETYAKILGFTYEELMNHTTITANVWIDLDERNAAIGQLVEKGTIEARKLKVRKKDGEIKEVWFSAELIELNNEKYSIGIIQVA
jgi:PAS domain S-box-containing protein